MNIYTSSILKKLQVANYNYSSSVYGKIPTEINREPRGQPEKFNTFCL